jgi:hypothetical protein
VFRLPLAVQILRGALHEALKIYEFEVRELRVEDDRVSFFYLCRGRVCGYTPQSGTAPAKTVPTLKNLKRIHFFRGFFLPN